MPFIHGRIYNNHRHKTTFTKSVIWTMIVMCISCLEALPVAVYDLKQDKLLNNLCDMYLFKVYNTLVETPIKRNPGEVVVVNLNSKTAKLFG